MIAAISYRVFEYLPCLVVGYSFECGEGVLFSFTLSLPSIPLLPSVTWGRLVAYFFLIVCCLFSFYGATKFDLSIDDLMMVIVAPGPAVSACVFAVVFVFIRCCALGYSRNR